MTNLVAAGEEGSDSFQLHLVSETPHRHIPLRATGQDCRSEKNINNIGRDGQKAVLGWALKAKTSGSFSTLVVRRLAELAEGESEPIRAVVMARAGSLVGARVGAMRSEGTRPIEVELVRDSADSLGTNSLRGG